MKRIIMAACAAVTVLAAHAQTDWANHNRYAEANAALTKAPEVVFMGNSITDGWDDNHPEFFTDNNFACRGISGQVSGQMLCRFYADVIALKPKAVVILGGVNDIALNQGPIEIENIAQNIESMAELAICNGIRPLICSPLPCDSILWRPEVVNTATRVAALNALLKDYCDRTGVTYVDYYSAMTTPEGALNPDYTNDHIHPTRAGYAVMEPIVLAAINERPCCRKKSEACGDGMRRQCRANRTDEKPCRR